MKLTNVNSGCRAPASVHRAWTPILTGAVALVLAWPAVAQAGSVFMKNGYIIQGRIVDRDSDSVVMGWPNGKVSIAHRFVESVVLEPEEEERIRQLEEARRAETTEEGGAQRTSILEVEDDVELPPTLELFMLSYQRSSSTQIPDLLGLDTGPLDSPDGADLGLDGSPDPFAGDPGGETVTSVDSIEPPSLGPRATHPGTGVAIEPPGGWEPTGTDTILAFRESEGEGFRASFNIVAVDPVPADRDSFVDLLREENRGQLLGYEVLDEGPAMLAGLPAYRLIGRGTFGGQTALVEQRLLVSDGKLWLVSVFTPADATDARGEALRSSVDASLASIEIDGAVAGGEVEE